MICNQYLDIQIIIQKSYSFFTQYKNEWKEQKILEAKGLKKEMFTKAKKYLR